jgi:LPXTG-motif cell wall-anchored protein
MSRQRIFGLVILAVGIVLLIFGIHAMSELREKFAQEFAGRYTHGTMWYIIGGVILIVVGGGVAMIRRRRR